MCIRDRAGGDQRRPDSLLRRAPGGLCPRGRAGGHGLGRARHDPGVPPPAGHGRGDVYKRQAYTGAASVACAAAGAAVCHVDAAKGMVSWARENAASSGQMCIRDRSLEADCGKGLFI